MPRDTQVVFSPAAVTHAQANTLSPTKNSELHKSAYKGAITELDSLLMEDGADVNQLGAQNRTPLHRAVGGKSASTVSFLIERGATVNTEDDAGRTPLHWSAIVGSSECAQVLVKAGANVNAMTKTGKTPLHMGAEAGMLDFVRYLVSLPEVDKTTRDGKNQTAYELAKKGEHKEVMELVRSSEDAASCCVII